MNHDELRHLLGAYVLGGLSHDDRSALEAHLDECAECRAELVAFAPVPGLLGQSAPPPAESVVPDLLPPLLTAVRRERLARRRRLALVAVVAVAAAVALIFVGGLALLDRTPSPAPTPAPAAVVSLDSPGGAKASTGTAELVEKAWGTALTLEASNLPATGPFTLEVIGPDGRAQRAATWGPTPTGQAVVAGATSLRRQEIRAVRVLDPSGAVLSGELS